MGIFTRVRDIISANINSMLDKAEDPEKLVKLMIREMEDTLVEVKASCAGAMATKKKVQRESEKAAENANAWEQKAELAIEKGRDDLAREALVEKKRYTERGDALESELEQCDGLVGQYQGDISQLEEKLDAAREKQRMFAGFRWPERSCRELVLLGKSCALFRPADSRITEDLAIGA